MSLPKQPNILFLFTDQQRPDTIAALGNPIIRTPNLDRLVREGVTFRRAYSPSPVCVSARCSLMTGKAPHKTGCFDNMPQPQDVASFVERLREAGYQTMAVGKQHFTPDYHRMWGYEKRAISEELQDDEYCAYLRRQGYEHIIDPRGLRGEMYYIPQPAQVAPEHHESAWVADRTLDFLSGRDRSRPFYLMSSFIRPHPPFDPPAPWYRLYRTAEMPLPKSAPHQEELFTFWNLHQNRYKYRDQGCDEYLVRTLAAFYYASISFVDYQIGRILDALGDEIQNTLIVFSSDHGELLGDYGCFGKRSMMEPSAGVPLLMRLPNGEASGTVCMRPVTLLDIGPTFLKAAGVEQYKMDPEGDDLKGIAVGEIARNFAYSQFSHRNTGLYLTTDGTWKYVYSAADQKEFLFNLKFDPEESRNLANNRIYREELSHFRTHSVNRFAADGYFDAVEGASWKQYPKFSQTNDLDYGLIVQDPPDLQQRINALGEAYARRMPDGGSDSHAELERVLGQIDCNFIK